MKINLILTPWFRKYFDGNKTVTVEMDNIISLKELICNQRINIDEIGFIQVNGYIKGYEYLLKEDDNVKIYPNIIGG